MPIVEAGAEGIVVYQETYNRGVYAEMHTAGPKLYFFFQAEDGIRGLYVTGVQTCALPICSPTGSSAFRTPPPTAPPPSGSRPSTTSPRRPPASPAPATSPSTSSSTPADP